MRSARRRSGPRYSGARASPGVYGRTGLYHDVLQRLDAYVTGMRDSEAEVLAFPPVMSRAQLEKSGYLKSFPNLLGCVCALHGTETEIRAAADRHESGGDWTRSLAPSDLVLSPAACYPVYPLAAARGRACRRVGSSTSPPTASAGSLPGHSIGCSPSGCASSSASAPRKQVQAFREEWIARAPRIAGELGLPCRVEVASDPFFGRVGPGDGGEPDGRNR